LSAQSTLAEKTESRAYYTRRQIQVRMPLAVALRDGVHGTATGRERMRKHL
jgi:hypothetical protein